jgi:DNA ligase (NAD+)
MSKSNLKRLNDVREKSGEELFANPRNAAAGSIRQLDPKIAASRKLDNFAYDLAQTSEKFPTTQSEELEYLEELGFKVNKNRFLAKSVADIISYWKKWQKEKLFMHLLIARISISVPKKTLFGIIKKYIVAGF